MNNTGHFKRKSVLILEDQVQLRESLVVKFEGFGCEVLVASDGADAFKTICEQNIDLLITDVRMLSGSGQHLLEKIKARRASTPAVILVTDTTHLWFTKTYELVADVVVTRPYSRDELTRVAARLLISPRERWSAQPDQNEGYQYVQRTFQSLAAAEAQGSLCLGRGGFFLHRCDGELIKLGGKISFCIQFEEGDLLLLEGTALVRWLRTEGGGGAKAGSWMEFRSIADSCREQVLSTIALLPTKVFLRGVAH